MKFLVPKIPMGRLDYRGCRLPLNGRDWQSQVSLPQDSPSLGYSDYLMAVHPTRRLQNPGRVLPSFDPAGFLSKFTRDEP